MNFNFKEALQTEKRRLEEKNSLEYKTEFYLKLLKEDLKSSRILLKVKKIHFFTRRVDAEKYLLDVAFTDQKEKKCEFSFNIGREFTNKEEMDVFFKTIKEKLKKDGFEIKESNIGYSKMDSFSIEID